ncbi:MAG: hypothetical protein ACKVPX_10080 [Myxococcaceae bacterium]
MATPSGAQLQTALENAGRFFMGDADVQRAMRRLVESLEKAEIPYAIVGAMALNAFGYERVTRDVDVLLTREGLGLFRQKYLGRGYVEKFPGSKGLRDTENNVAIDVILAGEFPGDGRPKPVVFPDPAEASKEGTGVALLPIAKLIELKLASGMSAPHRLRDLADVLELIRINRLSEDLAGALDPSVRTKYRELWKAASEATPEE